MSTTIIEVPRRKHRGRRALIAFLVVIVVLVALVFVGDFVARKIVTNYVQQQVETALNLSSTAPISVDLGPGSVLLQAASGSLNNLDVSVSPLVIDGYSGSATMTAKGVPLSGTTPVEQLKVAVDVPETTITKAITSVPSLAAFKPTVTITGQRVNVDGSVSIFGLSQKIGISMVPQVTAGVPSLSIKSATLDGVTISITQLDRYVPGLSKVLQSGTSICIADQLPKTFVLTGLELRGSSLVSTFTGTGVEFNEASLSHKGTC